MIGVCREDVACREWQDQQDQWDLQARKDHLVNQEQRARLVIWVDQVTKDRKDCRDNQEIPEVTADRVKMADREFAGKTASRESKDPKGLRVWQAYRVARDHLAHVESQGRRDHRENQAHTGSRVTQGKTASQDHRAPLVPRGRRVLEEQSEAEVHQVSRDLLELKERRERQEHRENTAK